jgi:hypothetical protein
MDLDLAEISADEKEAVQAFLQKKRKQEEKKRKAEEKKEEERRKKEEEEKKRVEQLREEQLRREEEERRAQEEEQRRQAEERRRSEEEKRRKEEKEEEERRNTEEKNKKEEEVEREPTAATVAQREPEEYVFLPELSSDSSEFGSPMTRKLTNPMLPPNPKRRRSEVVIVPPPPAPSMAAVTKDLVSAVKSMGVEIGKMANSIDLLRRELRMLAPPQPPIGTRPPREVQDYVARGGRGMNSPGRGKGRRGWSGRGNGYYGD